MTGYGYCHQCDRKDAAILYGSPSYGWLWHCADHADCRAEPRGEGSTGYTGPRSTDIDTLRTLNAETGGHWFDRSTMRFFDSRTAQRAYLSADGALAFFVSSERFLPSDGPAYRRTYSVRVMHLTTGENPRTQRGSVETVGAFEQYADRRGADRAARAMAADPSDYLDSIAQDSTREAANA